MNRLHNTRAVEDLCSCRSGLQEAISRCMKIYPSESDDYYAVAWSKRELEVEAYAAVAHVQYEIVNAEYVYARAIRRKLINWRN